MWIVECCQDYRLSATYSHEVWITKYLLIFKVKSKKILFACEFSLFYILPRRKCDQIKRKVVHKSLAIGFNHSFKIFHFIWSSLPHFKAQSSAVVIQLSMQFTSRNQIKYFYTIYIVFFLIGEKDLNFLPLLIDLYLKWLYTVQTK